MGENVSDHDLKSGRGRKSASLEHVRGRVCVVSADCVSGIEERSLHSRDDRRGGEEFGLIGSLGALCGNNVLRESLALYADNSVVALCGNGDDVEVDRRSDNTSVVVIGVISGNLTASADREKLNSVAVRSVDLGKSIDRRGNARTVCVGAVGADSALCGKLRIEFAGEHFVLKFRNCHCSNSFSDKFINLFLFYHAFSEMTIRFSERTQKFALSVRADAVCADDAAPSISVKPSRG